MAFSAGLLALVVALAPQGALGALSVRMRVAPWVSRSHPGPLLVAEGPAEEGDIPTPAVSGHPIVPTNGYSSNGQSTNGFSVNGQSSNGYSSGGGAAAAAIDVKAEVADIEQRVQATVEHVDAEMAKLLARKDELLAQEREVLAELESQDALKAEVAALEKRVEAAKEDKAKPPKADSAEAGTLQPLMKDLQDRVKATLTRADTARADAAEAEALVAAAREAHFRAESRGRRPPHASMPPTPR